MKKTLLLNKLFSSSEVSTVVDKNMTKNMIKINKNSVKFSKITELPDFAATIQHHFSQSGNMLSALDTCQLRVDGMTWHFFPLKHGVSH